MLLTRALAAELIGTFALVFAGAGLGLSLARRLARAASGDVTVEPGPHGRFVVRLPAA